jgi:N-methylhydantoinase A
MSDLRRDYFVTRLIEQSDSASLDELLRETIALARDKFISEGGSEDRITLQPLLRCRYQNQEFAVEVPIAPGPFGPDEMKAMIANFHAIYEREYSYRLDPLPVTGASITSAVKGRRDVDYATEGIHAATIYDGEKLEPGMRFEGPAIIEDPGTTIVVHPRNRVHIDAYGNTHIEIRT